MIAVALEACVLGDGLSGLEWAFAVSRRSKLWQEDFQFETGIVDCINTFKSRRECCKKRSYIRKFAAFL